VALICTPVKVDNNQEAAINVLSTNAQLLRSDSESNDAAVRRCAVA